jgi:hypothetical protein
MEQPPDDECAGAIAKPNKDSGHHCTPSGTNLKITFKPTITLWNQEKA